MKPNHSARQQSLTEGRHQLVSAKGTSLTNQAQIYVAAPAPPTVDTPIATGVTATTETLGGSINN